MAYAAGLIGLSTPWMAPSLSMVVQICSPLGSLHHSGSYRYDPDAPYFVGYPGYWLLLGNLDVIPYRTNFIRKDWGCWCNLNLKIISPGSRTRDFTVVGRYNYRYAVKAFIKLSSSLAYSTFVFPFYMRLSFFLRLIIFLTLLWELVLVSWHFCPLLCHGSKLPAVACCLQYSKSCGNSQSPTEHEKVWVILEELCVMVTNLMMESELLRPRTVACTTTLTTAPRISCQLPPWRPRWTRRFTWRVSRSREGRSNIGTRSQRRVILSKNGAVVLTFPLGFLFWPGMYWLFLPPLPHLNICFFLWQYHDQEVCHATISSWEMWNVPFFIWAFSWLLYNQKGDSFQRHFYWSRIYLFSWTWNDWNRIINFGWYTHFVSLCIISVVCVSSHNSFLWAA